MNITGLIQPLLTGGGGAAIPIVVMFAMFTPADQMDDHEADFNRHVADSARGYILDTVERAANTEPGDYKASLCRTLEEAMAELCSAAPQDSICVDRAMYFERAGC